MMTTISAFMVKITPPAALKVRNIEIKHPRRGAQRAGTRGKDKGRSWRGTVPCRRGCASARVDRDRAHCHAGARPGQGEINPGADDVRGKRNARRRFADTVVPMTSTGTGR